MNSLGLNTPFFAAMVIFVICGPIWLGSAIYLRAKRKKDYIFLFFFTLFFFYIYKVLDYTLFQFQFLLVLKYFFPNLMLNGRTPGESINLVPLVTLTSADFKTSILNILLMVPFGLGLPLLMRLRLGRVTLLGGVFSFAIEMIQLVSGLLANTTFRIADINDLIFNTIGAMVGYGLFQVVLATALQAIKATKTENNPIARYLLDVGEGIKARNRTASK